MRLRAFVLRCICFQIGECPGDLFCLSILYAIMQTKHIALHTYVHHTHASNTLDYQHNTNSSNNITALQVEPDFPENGTNYSRTQANVSQQLTTSLAFGPLQTLSKI